MKRVLIIGNSHDKHLSRFIKGLRSLDVDYAIDILDVSMRQDLCESNSLYDRVCISKRTHPDFIYKIPLLNKLCKYRDTVLAFKNIVKDYSLISVQFITIQAGFLYSSLKKNGAKLIVTPWGSDIYRIGAFQRNFTRKLLAEADFVTLMPSSKFGDDVKREYQLAESICLPLCFGSDILDAIFKDSKSRADCKKQLLGSADKFTITIGYNASSAQNHLQVIEAISNIKKILPSNTILLLPMTYSKVESYMDEVRFALDELGVEYRIFDKYLSDEEVLDLRKGTDIFIHMQKTDAYSSSLQEALLSKSKVINADWLRYKELEKDGLPYYLANFNNLTSVISQALTDSCRPIDITDALRCYTWTYQLAEWNKLYKQYC